ncbi:MAG TPA: MarR family transcriptional regulator [Oxalicibacterium sp.]|uniref:MarR family winged helix-turn-helix transcriptional regulator n=1 Tax=Oxalicibacterium sp. TaxID=2766525 RepID=UPI002C628A0C|nr:MarR family transcriptional regulator [Oxalicibacterium sp.]HWU97608.1 MarR family transcriptional regulator [Oxalicibacterium sp.]
MSKTRKMDESFPALDELLCFSIYSAGHAFNQLYRPALDQIGLTYPQYLVLVVLWASNDRTVKEIGLALHLDSSTLTPLLKRLETAGYVTRNRDPADERQVRIRLTKKGEMLKEPARAIPKCAENAVDLPIETIKRLLADVSSLRDMLVAKSS